jgi:hypothetical protein
LPLDELGAHSAVGRDDADRLRDLTPADRHRGVDAVDTTPSSSTSRSTVSRQLGDRIGSSDRDPPPHAPRT